MPISTPVSIPVTPPQSDLPSYGLRSLELFDRYTRSSYLAKFGVPAPKFIPDLNAKDWFDSTVDLSDPLNITIYVVSGHNGKGEPILKQFIIKTSEAVSVNLPDEGSGSFPPYVIAPTTATRTGPGNLAPQPVNPIYLSTIGQANTLGSEVGGTRVQAEQSMGGGFAISYPPGEVRRLWEITFNGRNTNVGLLLNQKNSRGVGAPGKWDLTQQEPVWVPEPSVVVDASQPHTWVPYPVRSLLPNERLQQSALGVIEIIRTDKQTASGTSPVGPSSGGFSSQHAKQLDDIWRKTMGVG